MIEPEVAFNDLKDNIDLTEEFLKYLSNYVLENYADDLKFLNDRDVKEQSAKPAKDRNPLTLIERLEFVANNEFKRITYTRSEEHTSELQSRPHLVCRLLLEKKKKT